MCSLCPCYCFNNKNMATAFVKPSKQTRAKLDSFVAGLKKKGIKLLALDFDLTIIDIHSKGMWEDGVDKLAVHVRPCMKDLMETAVNKGIFVAIVTYHKQDWLIKELLHKVLPKKIANKIYVQANTIDFLKRHRTSRSSSEGESSRPGAPDLNGKQAHIAAVINDIYKDHGVALKKEEIILMDDDIRNIRIASSYGHHAFQVQQDVDYPSFENFEMMLLLIANKIYVQANTIDFLQRHRTSPSCSEGEFSRSGAPDLNGKQEHIAFVINDIYKDHGVALKKEEIILMDDDMRNIRIASSYGHHAFQVQQDVDYPSFENFETMLLL